MFKGLAGLTAGVVFNVALVSEGCFFSLLHENDWIDWLYVKHEQHDYFESPSGSERAAFHC